MDADWYADPLDRFDGRFFDGRRWTERVSDGGSIAIDPDFPPKRRRTVRTDLPAAEIVESPVRVVAVLDAAPSADPHDESNDADGMPKAVWGLVAAIVALGLVGWLFVRGGDSSEQVSPADADRIEDIEAAGTDVDAPDDLEALDELDEANEVDGSSSDAGAEEAIDAPPGSIDLDTDFGPDELIRVGALDVVNGQSLLRDLGQWHVEFAGERRIVLGDDARCWFVERAGAAQQFALCGPVSASVEDGLVYDLVPLVFADVDSGQLAQPVVDAAKADVLLDPTFTLLDA